MPVKDEGLKPRLGYSMGSLTERSYQRAYIGLGSNIDPANNLSKAFELLSRHVIIDEIAHTWETPAVGSKGPNFLNTAASVRTPLPPRLLKSLVLRRIERELGRVRTDNKNSPRTIDLDILVYEGQVLDPKVWSFAFVAVPLSELLPDLRNPKTGETLKQTASRLAGVTPLKSRPDISAGKYS